MRKANPLHALIVVTTFSCWACVDDGGGPQNEGDVAQDGTSQAEPAGGAVAESGTDITRSDSGDPECESNDDCDDGFACDQGSCKPLPCEDDEACQDGEVCVEGACIEGQRCEVEDDCPSDATCTDGFCKPQGSCMGDRQCDADEICEDGRCQTRPECREDSDCEGLEDCVGDRCVPGICRGNDDCDEGEICFGGECTLPPDIQDEATPTIVEIIILTRPRAVSPETEIPFQAYAVDSEGTVVTTQGFDWVSDAPSTLTISDVGVATAQSDPGTARVTARLTLADDTIVTSNPVVIEVVVPVMRPEPVIIRAIDKASGAPVEGAVVYYGQGQIAVTDAEGLAGFESPGEGLLLTVFSEGHDYLSIYGLGAGQYQVPLSPRSPGRDVAGFVGNIDYSGVMTPGMLELGLSGSSFSGGITAIDFDSLIGELFNVQIPFGPDVEFPLPGGLTLGGLFPLKTEFYALAQQGRQVAWSFGGRANLLELRDLFEGGPSGGFNIGGVLATILPLFENFEHGLRLTEELEAFPRVLDVDDINANGSSRDNIPDYDVFPRYTLSPAQPQSLRLNYLVPESLEESGLTLLFSGVQVPQLGFVPLGVSAAEASGGVAARMAPPYNGLESGERTFIALNAEFGGFTTLPRDLSMVIKRTGQSVPGNIDFATGFLPLPEFASWDPVENALFVEFDDAPSFHRAVFAGEAGRWMVYFPPQSQQALEFAMPTPPMGYPNLSLGDDIRYEAIVIPPENPFTSLLELGGAKDLGDIDALVQAISRIVP